MKIIHFVFCVYCSLCSIFKPTKKAEARLRIGFRIPYSQILQTDDNRKIRIQTFKRSTFESKWIFDLNFSNVISLPENFNSHTKNNFWTCVRTRWMFKLLIWTHSKLEFPTHLNNSLLFIANYFTPPFFVGPISSIFQMKSSAITLAQLWWIWCTRTPKLRRMVTKDQKKNFSSWLYCYYNNLNITGYFLANFLDGWSN